MCVEKGRQSFFRITWKRGNKVELQGFARECAVSVKGRTQLELNACNNALKLTTYLESTMPTMPCKTKELTGTHSCTLSQFK